MKTLIQKVTSILLYTDPQAERSVAREIGLPNLRPVNLFDVPEDNIKEILCELSRYIPNCDLPEASQDLFGIEVTNTDQFTDLVHGKYTRQAIKVADTLIEVIDGVVWIEDGFDIGNTNLIIEALKKLNSDQVDV